MKSKSSIILFFLLILCTVAANTASAKVILPVNNAIDSVKVIQEKGKKEEVKEIPKSKPQKRPEPVKAGKGIKRPDNIRPKGLKPSQIKRPGNRGAGKKNG